MGLVVVVVVASDDKCDDECDDIESAPIVESLFFDFLALVPPPLLLLFLFVLDFLISVA